MHEVHKDHSYSHMKKKAKELLKKHMHLEASPEDETFIEETAHFALVLVIAFVAYCIFSLGSRKKRRALLMQKSI